MIDKKICLRNIIQALQRKGFRCDFDSN